MANAASSKKRWESSEQVVEKWLERYDSMPYMKGEKAITPVTIETYINSLGKLRSPECLDRAFKWCMEHIQFLPMVSEVMARYGIELEAMSKPEAYELCGDCQGTGWRMVPREDGKGTWAVACECRKRGAA